jgi:Pvc16 N-terminal domain
MSNTLAITSVTSAFAQLVTNAIAEAGISASVRLEPPDPQQGLQKALVNLFLYEIGPGAAFRANDAPFRDARGELIHPSVLPLNLRYLLTVYGKGATASGGNQLEAQHLLAHVMSYVNDNAALTRALVRDGIRTYGTGTASLYDPLRRSDLDAQPELVKLTPLPFTPEETSKLWSALNQAYRLSVVYEASVVFVERRRPKKEARPVAEVGIHALPTRRAVVASIAPQIAVLPDTLTVEGEGFASEDPVFLRFPFGDFDVTAAAADPAANTTLTNTRIATPLRRVNTALGQAVRAGSIPVQVVHQVRMGLPPAPGQPAPLHRGFESNMAVFALAPRITSAVVVPPAAPEPRRLEVKVEPRIESTQRVALVLGASVVEDVVRPAATDPVPPTTDTVTFRIPSFAAGTYAARVRVDDAESPSVQVNVT